MSNMSKLAHIDPEDLIESQSEGSEEQLPTYLFEDIEEELTKILFLDTGLEETDGGFDVIIDIVSRAQHEISKRGAGESLNKFSKHSHQNLHSLAQHKGRYCQQNC